MMLGSVAATCFALTRRHGASADLKSELIAYAKLTQAYARAAKHALCSPIFAFCLRELTQNLTRAYATP